LQGNVDCAFNVPIRKFRFAANIDDYEVLVEGDVHRQLVRLHVDDHIDGFAGLLPGFEATLQITFDLVEAHTGETDDTFLFFAGSGDEHYGLGERQDTAGPLGEAAVETNADRAGDEACNKKITTPGVEQYGVLVDPLFEGGDVEGLQAGLQNSVETLVAFFIDPRVDGEIVRRSKKTIRYGFDELFPGLLLECIIRFFFFYEGAIGAGTQVLAAAAAGTVRRIDYEIIRQRHDLRTKGVVKHARQLFTAKIAAAEIGAADVAHE